MKKSRAQIGQARILHKTNTFTIIASNFVWEQLNKLHLGVIYYIPLRSDMVINKTYPADCRKIAAVDSNKHDWDWNRYWKKKIFVQKQFLSPIYFDGIS